MKFSEVIKKLEEDNNKTFEAYTADEWRLVLFVSHGYFHLKVYDDKEEFYSQDCGAGAFNGNVSIDGEWREIRGETTDFITAVNSGKRIKPSVPDVNFMDLTEIQSFLYVKENETDFVELLNSKWEIEPDYKGDC